MSWHFETDCIHSDGDSINDMKAKAKAVTFRTMQRVLGRAFSDAQRELGYATGAKRDLHMKDDFMVSYWKSEYRGKPCYYFAWSGIEHVFLNKEQS